MNFFTNFDVYIFNQFQTFFKEVNKANLKKNVLISPLSAYQVFGLTSNGAKGTTQNSDSLQPQCRFPQSLQRVHHIPSPSPQRYHHRKR